MEHWTHCTHLIRNLTQISNIFAFLLVNLIISLKCIERFIILNTPASSCFNTKIKSGRNHEVYIILKYPRKDGLFNIKLRLNKKKNSRNWGCIWSKCDIPAWHIILTPGLVCPKVSVTEKHWEPTIQFFIW